MILDYLRVSVQSLTIAGGLLLLLVALQMFRGEEMTVNQTTNIALVPLATPLLAGPGAIAAVMVLTSRYADTGGRLAVVAGIAVVVVMVATILFIADPIARLLRPSAISLLSRVLALLLSAMAVPLIIDAIRNLHG